MADKKLSVTTKSGDDGYTDIIGGSRLPKDHPIPECLGVIDELSAFLGDAKAALDCCNQDCCNKEAGSTAEIINDIQKDLIQLMGVVAGMPVPADGLGEERLNDLIINLESKLPPLTSFAVPGANPVSAKLHIARTVCRRAERRIVSLGGEKAAVIGPYINRLSDVLFLLSQKEYAGK